MKKVLITGDNSYIGESVKDYLLQWPDNYSISVKDTMGWSPAPSDFKNIDIVFNVAGIAHIEETKENQHLYYKVNRDLAVNIAKAAKAANVKQFILLSTMAVYGLVVGHITKTTPVHPVNVYGKSKAEADEAIERLKDESFKFCCLRPPMVYGKGCKGNYQALRRFVLKSPVFPDYKNQRSMIYIGNLCEFVKECIDEQKSGLFFPQNAEYVNTSEMVERIAVTNGKKIKLIKIFNPIIKRVHIKTLEKVCGSLCYEQVDIVGRYSFADSISMTENQIVSY